MLEMEISNTEMVENIKCRITYKEYLIWNSFEDNTESKCKYLRRYYPRDLPEYLGYINNYDCKKKKIRGGLKSGL